MSEQCRICDERMPAPGMHGGTFKTEERCALEALVRWYESGAKDEISTMFALAWAHGFRSHYDPNEPNLEQLMTKAKAILGR